MTPPQPASERFSLVVRVKPGSSKPRVGGIHGDGELIVAVAQRPVDGAATEAVLGAVAKAFGVAARDVELVSGATARTKVLRLTGDPVRLAARRAELLGQD